MPAQLYQRDLAYIHHVGFGDFATSAAPEWLRILRRAGIRGGTLVDLGCGSGLWARAATRAGFRVIGVDASAAMLGLARRAAPSVEFCLASLHDFELPACDAVTVLGEGLNYVSPKESRAAPVARLFDRVARALRPGGMLLFDVMVREGPAMNGRSWRAGEDWVVLVEAEEDRSAHRLTRRITTFRRVGGHYRRTDETHRLRLFSQAGMASALRRAGFSVRVGNRYGKIKLLPRRLAFLALRRSLNRAPHSSPAG